MHTRVTIKDVAARAQVSFQTVSKVLNHQMQVSPETEARIWDAVRALGYTPDHRARNLRTRRSHMLGYSWAPLPPDQSNAILDLFLQSMMTAAEAAGYHILLFPHPERRAQVAAYRDLLRTGRVDGFILSSVEYNDLLIPFLQKEGFPFCAFGRTGPQADFPYVEVDGAAGLRLATDHLLSLGHRKIAALTRPPSSRVAKHRLDGYLEGLRAAGIRPQPKWIARGQETVNFGYTAARAWLTLPKPTQPTAIVAYNDAMAVGAMRAVQEKGLRVGDDIAITGFDDAPMAQYLTPPLTSVRQPVWQVGEQVIAILTRLLESPENAKSPVNRAWLARSDGHPPLAVNQVILAPQLIIRESSTGTRRLVSNTTPAAHL